jgi:hypothetical protein
MSTPTSVPGLTDLPLWRLLVELDDAERKLGPDSQTTRLLAAAIKSRLKTENEKPSQVEKRKRVHHA